MGKMDNEILAVPTKDISEILKKITKNGGFTSFSSEDEYLSMLDLCITKRRGDLEEDPSFKQIIAYGIIKFQNKILYYVRAPKGNETRLLNKKSIGIGGHIEIEDVEAAEETVRLAFKRESREEFNLDLKNIKPLGYIYLDEEGVSSVHLGILFVGEAISAEITTAPDEVVKAEFVTADELTNLINNPESNVEGWSKVAWEYGSKLVEQ